ncbi:MAG: methionine--tRNA ligase [Chlamydiota bacterium]|nr:methionine--tRNA ligase [Chlamydiota bacterium]
MDETREKILITSALPYANGPLHFGHIAGAYLPGDCYARFQRLKGSDVLYVCGSDEYGVAITLSAEMAGRTPKEHVDIFHAINKKFFDQLGISFDHYSRTTCESHKAPVYDYFQQLLKNGFIEEKVTDQLYSEEDNRFLADRYVIGTCPQCGFENARGDECPKCGTSYEATDLKNPRSKLTNAPLQKKATKHWFIMLDKFKQELTEWIERKQWKPNVTNFVKEYIKGLRPRAITRDSDWGLPVPLPNAEGKVLYVWFDAPIGYISASMEWAKSQGTPDAWKEYWLDQETKLVQFIGKDNIPFHAAIFPAMTMGQDLPYKIVDELPANEFYNLEGKQFSKSEGWYIDLETFFSKYSTDQIRYAIAANAPETQDSEFTWRDFQSRCNAELLGKYGNFVNRVLVFAFKSCGGTIPERGELEEIDKEFLQSIHRLVDEIAESYEHFKLRKASQLMMELAQHGNAYFDSKHPWKDVKGSETFSRMETTISCCIECLHLLALTSYPIIPSTAQKIWEFLGNSRIIDSNSWERLKKMELSPGASLAKPEILFRKIEDDEINQELENLKKMTETAKSEKEPTYEKLKENVDFSDFQKLDLRVGTVLESTKVPKSKKLLKLIVDLGFEKRTVLSGISQHYEPEALVGKKVVVVANLKPAKIMGIESEGMILAGSYDSNLELAGISELPAGSVVR